MSRSSRHQPVRELLARRVDEPLPPLEEAGLVAHLERCPRCRAIAHEYEAERDLLRGLRVIEPPRDLWARTATALDHELARGGHRRAIPAVASLATLGVALAVVGTQVGLFRSALTLPEALATPFAVTPQPIAYITRNGDEWTIYRTQVSDVCPRPRYDCTDPSSDARTILRVEAPADPSDIALSAAGRLVITGRDGKGHAIYSVLELPQDAPRATPVGASMTPWPRPTGTKPAHTPATSSSPATSIAPPASPSATSTPAPTEARPILTDVFAAGAPAAWSADGSVLAFSAMPVDSSRGPDIYTWRAGDPVARPLTKDHRSWFASWAGNRILVSRVPQPAPKASAGGTGSSSGDATPAPAPLTPQTFLIDPGSGIARAVPLARAWLPSVDPTGRFVIYWHGTVAGAATGVRPLAGALELADWRGLDPFAPRAVVAPSGAAATPSGSAGVDGQRLRTAGSVGPGPVDPEAAPSSGPTPDATPSTTFAPQPIAVQRDVGDWLVRWADDGSAYGLWVATSTDDVSGILQVSATPAPTTAPTADLLSPTPALRAFSIGQGRVAWVAPLGATDGELRVATWGPGGNGGVRVRRVEPQTLAF